jgi:putative transposase
MTKLYTEEQIISTINEHEAGAKVANICRSLSISFGTFYNWRSKYAGLEVNEAKRLTELDSQSMLPRI